VQPGGAPKHPYAATLLGKPVKSTKECPKCHSKDLRWEVLQVPHVNPQRFGAVTITTPALAQVRLFDSYVCAGCGYTELYFRM